ncbi:MAG: hypothetical protein AAGI46_16055 [Planctomycetota bacterium]
MGRIVTSGDSSYEFVTDWVKVGKDGNRAGGPTHGVQVLRDGRIVVFHQNAPGDDAIIFFDADGNRLSSFGDYPGAHGLTAAGDALWVTDEKTAAVHKLSLDGKLIRELAPPPQSLIDDNPDPARRRFVPTWAVEMDNGDVMVADGYGTHRVYRYGPSGSLDGHLDGVGEAGRFNEPHGIEIGPTGAGGESELWVTDRSNRRVCVYKDGSLARHSDTACHSPAAFAFHDGLIYVAEIAGSVKILDPHLNVLADLAQSPDITPLTREADPGWVPLEQNRPEGWPNVAEGLLHAGSFHTPHGIDVDADGNIYVVEWYVGGRVSKLIRQ